MIRPGSDHEAEGHAGVADVAIATGRYADARSQLASVVIAAEKQQNVTLEVKAKVALSDLDLEAGDRVRASDMVRHFDPGRMSPVAILLVGRVLARAREFGELGPLQRRLDEILKTLDNAEVRSIQSMLGAWAAAPRDPAAAVDSAERAVRYHDSAFAREVLARVYVAAGRDRDAIGEFEKVLARANERALSIDGPAFHSLVDVNYELAVLLQRAGDATRARTHLDFFLRLWASPDPGLPRYLDAQQRLRVVR